MTYEKNFSLGWIVVLSVFLTCTVMLPAPAQGQLSGDNAVWTTVPATTPTFSHSLIDASQLSGVDVCAKITSALLQIAAAANRSLYGSAAVIDARGINNIGCASGTPWSGTIPAGGWPAATILLPSGTIVIGLTWALPNGTRLIGEGEGGGSSVTTLQLPSGSSLSTMIQMGSGCSNVCRGVSVEHLSLDGQGSTSVTGILNTSSQDLSYVDHVSLYQILGTGLQISAQNSGPYTNISFNTGAKSAVTGTKCVQLSLSSTRGIYGLNCHASPDAQNAVLVDASNNTLGDVTIGGFYNGIVVGSGANAQDVVLTNIAGTTQGCGTACTTSPVNVVRLANTGNTVTNVVVLGVSNSGGAGSNTIEDDVTPTTISSTDAYVATYILGTPAGSNNSGYSRFTTSRQAATWFSGSGLPPNGSCTSALGGSLFSNTSGSVPALLYCPVGGVGTNWLRIQ